MEESDDSIRRAILSGEKDAYKVLVARYSQVVFRVAYRITGNEPDAEEAVQEAFLRGTKSSLILKGGPVWLPGSIASAPIAPSTS